MQHICSNARASPGQPAQWHKCCGLHITTGDTGLRSRYSLARANLVNRGVGLLPTIATPKVMGYTYTESAFSDASTFCALYMIVNALDVQRLPITVTDCICISALGSKMAPRPPNLDPRYPPDTPTWSQDGTRRPTWSQDGPQTPQLGAKMPPRPPYLEPRWTPDAPTYSQDTPQTQARWRGWPSGSWIYIYIYMYIYI